MHTWCEVKNFTSQKFRLTPVYTVQKLECMPLDQRWPESLFQNPTPLLFQNFGIRVRLFFKFENLTPVQTPATIINPTIIYPCFYLRNDHKDSCYCRNWKVTPVLEPVFPKYLTPDPGPKEKRRILPESTPVFRIRSHLCFRYDMHWLSTLTSCISWRSSDVTTRYDVPHSLNC